MVHTGSTTNDVTAYCDIRDDPHCQIPLSPAMTHTGYHHFLVGPWVSGFRLDPPYMEAYGVWAIPAVFAPDSHAKIVLSITTHDPAATTLVNFTLYLM